MNRSGLAKRRRLCSGFSKGLSTCSSKDLCGCIFKGHYDVSSFATMNRSGLAKRRRLCSGFSKGLPTCSTKDLCGCIFEGMYDLSSSTTKTSKSSSLDDLIDDVLIEILLRVPAKSLHRSKSVSKRWLSLISAPCFARRFILNSLSDRHHNSNKMLLFHIKRIRPSIGQIYGLPLLHDDFDKVSSPLSGSMLLTFDFIPALRPNNYDLREELSPLGVKERLLMDMDLNGVCGGLVLLRGIFRDRTDSKPYDETSPYFHYYVCNPDTKQWVELPLISTRDIVGFTCYYQQQAEGEGRNSRIWADAISYDNIIKHMPNYDPNKIEFTVVSINRDGQDDVFIIRVCSSTDETTKWSIFNVPFPPGYRWKSARNRTKVLFFNGKFHWCGDKCIAVYDPFNKPLECGIIQFPPVDPLQIEGFNVFSLEAYEGHLRLVIMFMPLRFSAWELVDYANKVWVEKFDVDVNDHGSLDFVGGASGDKVYIVAKRSTIMVYDVRNASLQHVYTYPINLDTGHNVRCVEPFMSNPWPTPVPHLQWK